MRVDQPGPVGRRVFGIGLTLLLTAALALPAAAHHRQPLEYVVTELGSLGGNEAAGISINNRGLVAGYASLPGDSVIHATIWRDGTLTDLQTLGGPNSAVLWPVKNNHGLVVGVTETADLDPLNEQWSCSLFFPSTTGHTCRGFVWEDGEMRELSTHGGTHGFATAANNRGLVVGWAETSEFDPTCAGEAGRNQQLGFVGALWDTRDGDRIHELPPLPGDSASTGNAINGRGQVAGISGDCDQAVGRFSAKRMALWENGVPTEIPSLGGETWNTPMAINDRGVVVGFANPEGSVGPLLVARPFVWTRQGGTDDLGTLDGDTQGQALGINNAGQIAGLSRGPGGFTAVVWHGGQITDLNLVSPGYDGHLLFANDINEDGVLTGAAISVESGEVVAFVATPIDG